VLNSSAIASGYAGRDPQGGFAMEALRVFIEIVKKTKESSSLFLKLRKWKRKLLKLRRKREMKKVKNQKTKESDKVQMKWKEE